MSDSMKTGKDTTLTLVGLLAMILLTMTKVSPSSQIAGYAALVGIAFFFLVEAAAKTRDAESGLRFQTVFEDIRRPGVLLWTLLPIVSAIATLVVGDLIFGGEFAAHVVGRTSSMLSFDRIPLLIGQVILGALGEEIAFRGFFVGKAMKIVPFWPCAVVSSVVFAAGHIATGDVGLVAYDVSTIFIDSMIYAVVYRKSGNCLVCAISHILCNAAGIAATFIFFLG